MRENGEKITGKTWCFTSICELSFHMKDKYCLSFPTLGAQKNIFSKKQVYNMDHISRLIKRKKYTIYQRMSTSWVLVIAFVERNSLSHLYFLYIIDNKDKLCYFFKKIFIYVSFS